MWKRIKKMPTDKDYPWDCVSKEYQKYISAFERINEADSLPYLIYKPKKNTDKCPLVVYLHGAGASGNDNNSQIENDSILKFVRKEWQDEHPCYILAPQCPRAKAWEMPDILDEFHNLLCQIIETNDDLDSNSIYLYGVSMGAIGAFSYLKLHPTMIKKALLACGATTEDNLDNLCEIPIRLYHSKDDNIVKCGVMEHPIFHIPILGSSAIYEVLKNKSCIEYFEIEPEYIHSHYGLKSHCAWAVAFDGTENMEWLFS